MMPVQLSKLPSWVIRVCVFGFGACAFFVFFVAFLGLAKAYGTTRPILVPLLVTSAGFAVWAASYLGSLVAIARVDVTPRGGAGWRIPLITVRGAALMAGGPALASLLLGGSYDTAAWARLLERMGTSFGQSLMMLLPVVMLASVRARHAR